MSTNFATAIVTSVQVNAIEYVITGFTATGTDETNTFVADNSTSIIIPFPVTQKKADRLLREEIAARLLTASGTFNFVIDPEDIWFPG